jgi:outer membrane murein-binding lipoprotein Lpp
MIKNIVRALPLAVVVALGTGCANNAKIDEASTTAATAEQTASDAKQAAAKALQAAQQAQKTADEALRVAKEAKAASAEANTKIDRAFKKSMAK